jgi:hypothetical protein
MTTTVVPANAIEPSPIRRRATAFPEGFDERAARVYHRFGNAVTVTYLDFLADFTRDAYPANTLRVWKRIATAFVVCARDHDWGKERRRELSPF